MPSLPMLGDSNSTQAFLASAAELHCNRSAAYLGLTIDNRSSGSLVWADQVAVLVPTASTSGILPGSADVPMFALGTNDAQIYGNAAGPREHGFVPNVRAGLIWVSSPNKLIPMINGTPNTNVARTSGWLQSPFSPIGIYATASSQFIDAYVSGPAVYIFGMNYANADADVFIDGTFMGTVSQRGATVAPYLTPRVGAIVGAVASGYGAWRIPTGKAPGVSSLMHLSVTTNGPSFCVEAIISADQIGRPRVVVGEIIRRGPMGYGNGNGDPNIQTMNGRIWDVVNEINGDGGNIRVAPLYDGVHPALYMNDNLAGDWIHINAAGHRKKHQLFVDAAMAA